MVLNFYTFSFFMKINELSDLTYLAISLYQDFYIETILLGFYILLTLIFVTLLLK